MAHNMAPEPAHLTCRVCRKARNLGVGPAEMRLTDDMHGTSPVGNVCWARGMGTAAAGTSTAATAAHPAAAASAATSRFSLQGALQFGSSPGAEMSQHP